MSVLTRFKTKLGQSPGQGACFQHGQTNFPGRVIKSRNDNAMVAEYEEVASLSPKCSTANKNLSTPLFGIVKQKSKKYLTYLTQIINNTFKSHVTQKNVFSQTILEKTFPDTQKA